MEEELKGITTFPFFIISVHLISPQLKFFLPNDTSFSSTKRSRSQWIIMTDT